MSSIYWGNRGHCPECGRFCGSIEALVGEMGLHQVVGKCSIHGIVDLTAQDWSFDEFYNGEEEVVDGGNEIT